MNLCPVPPGLALCSFVTPLFAARRLLARWQAAAPSLAGVGICSRAGPVLQQISVAWVRRLGYSRSNCIMLLCKTYRFCCSSMGRLWVCKEIMAWEMMQPCGMFGIWLQESVFWEGLCCCIWVKVMVLRSCSIGWNTTNAALWGKLKNIASYPWGLH